MEKLMLMPKSAHIAESGFGKQNIIILQAYLLGGLGLGVIIIGIFISPTAALITGGLLLLASALVKRAE
jgi:hypothetical protein